MPIISQLSVMLPHVFVHYSDFTKFWTPDPIEPFITTDYVIIYSHIGLLQGLQ